MTIDNIPLQTQDNSITISFIEMETPIIEEMIIPWFYRSFTNYNI